MFSTGGNGIGRRRRFAVGLSIVALGLVGSAVGASFSVWRPDGKGERIVAAPPQAAREAKSPPTAMAPARKQMPIPVRISIPAIGVDAAVVALGKNPDGSMQVPADPADTGWFRPGPEPGEQGAAVVVGHVATRNGPAVFLRLAALRAGQVITIRLRDGSRVRYVARSMIRVSKSRFPTSRVYARTKQPTLRLITCAGKLSPATGHHPDNYIVFASILR